MAPRSRSRPTPRNTGTGLSGGGSVPCSVFPPLEGELGTEPIPPMKARSRATSRVPATSGRLNPSEVAVWEAARSGIEKARANPQPSPQKPCQQCGQPAARRHTRCWACLKRAYRARREDGPLAPAVDELRDAALALADADTSDDGDDAHHLAELRLLTAARAFVSEERRVHARTSGGTLLDQEADTWTPSSS